MSAIRITDFHKLAKPFPAFLWAAAIQQLANAAKTAPRKKARSGQKLFCYGCQSLIEIGQRYRAASSDLVEGCGFHEECLHGLIAKARELDALNGTQFVDHLVHVRGVAA